MAAKKLTAALVESKMKMLTGWKLKKDGIEKNFVFKDFNEAFGFLTRIALLSERSDHHAEWSGVYNKVSIRLSTHDAGGITQKDITMASEIEKYVAS